MAFSDGRNSGSSDVKISPRLSMTNLDTTMLGSHKAKKVDIFIIGDVHVGKTSLLFRFDRNVFY